MPATSPICQPVSSGTIRSTASAKLGAAVMPSARRMASQPAPLIDPNECTVCGRAALDLWEPPCAFCPPDPSEPLKCRRCAERPIRSPFGLCRKCYDELPAAERCKYPQRRRRGSPRTWSLAEPTQLPGEPTEALPGTEEKLRVMVERLRRRQCLFHPRDAQSNPRDLMIAFVEMCVAREAGGVHWVESMCKWRARPWWTHGLIRYKRYHLGYWREREEAVRAVRQWRDLAAEIGPKQAMLSIRRARKRSTSMV